MDSRTFRIVGVVAVIGLVIGLFAIFLHPYLAERESLARLPQAERRAMFERAMADLQACSALGTEAPEIHCNDQAGFVLQLPDCDDPCRQLAESIKRGATR